MPYWLYRQLEQGPRITRRNIITSSGRLAVEEEIENEDPGVMNVLAQLIELDRSVKTAYLCHPAVVQVSKLPNEGGFCGYRNIQTLISYIQGAKAYGYKNFPGKIPGILELQDRIERAWDMGIDEVSRVQTGGIRGTRKYIGTPEVRRTRSPLVVMFCDMSLHEHVLRYQALIYYRPKRCSKA